MNASEVLKGFAMKQVYGYLDMKMKAQPEHPANIDALIENFDRALSHPDEDDLERLRKIILG